MGNAMPFTLPDLLGMRVMEGAPAQNPQRSSLGSRATSTSLRGRK